MVASKANQEDKGEEELAEDEIALITILMMESFRKSKNNRRGKNFGKGKYITDQPRNDGKCYECGKYSHISSECPKAKKNYSRRNQKKKALRSWSDEDNSENEHEEIGNICFMVVGKSSTEVCFEITTHLDRFGDPKELQITLALKDPKRNTTRKRKENGIGIADVQIT
ncbi:hypothetical protein KY284_020953 [Solanum tuberosum]|nr:hypothetical protein KY284_020953 [Solanum tuberosum]